FRIGRDRRAIMVPTREVSVCAPGDLFDRRRVLRYCGVLLGAEILVAVFLVAGSYGLIVPLAKPNTTDFVSFYAAGVLVDAGAPRSVYDQAEHHAAEQQATEAGIEYNYFYYPPVYLLYCAAFGHLPYLIAFITFEIITLVLYLLVAHGILDRESWAELLPV